MKPEKALVKYDDHQNKGTELGLFEHLAPKATTKSPDQQVKNLQELFLQRVFELLRMSDLNRVARANKTFNQLVFKGGFFKRVKSFPSSLPTDFIESVQSDIDVARFFSDIKGLELGFSRLARDRTVVDALALMNHHFATYREYGKYMEAARNGGTAYQSFHQAFLKYFSQEQLVALPEEYLERFSSDFRYGDMAFFKLILFGIIDMAQVAALPTVEHLDTLLGTCWGRIAVEEELITLAQAGTLSARRLWLLLVQGSQHEIGLRALRDEVISFDDVKNMPTDLHVDYLTAVRETTQYRSRERTWDGLGIILIREKLLTVEQFSKLPEQHLDELFNGHNGSGLGALKREVIDFDEIMAQPVGVGELKCLVEERMHQLYEEERSSRPVLK